MKTAAALLALLLALSPAARAAGIDEDASAATEISTDPFTGPVTVTAPRVRPQALENARAAGAGTAAAGGGLMTYAILFTAGGPFGWAAALVFLGGMTSYLSHRRLQGKEDFDWSVLPSSPPPPPQTARP